MRTSKIWHHDKYIERELTPNFTNLGIDFKKWIENLPVPSKVNVDQKSQDKRQKIVKEIEPPPPSPPRPPSPPPCPIIRRPVLARKIGGRRAAVPKPRKKKVDPIKVEEMEDQGVTAVNFNLGVQEGRCEYCDSCGREIEVQCCIHEWIQENDSDFECEF